MAMRASCSSSLLAWERHKTLVQLACKRQNKSSTNVNSVPRTRRYAAATKAAAQITSREHNLARRKESKATVDASHSDRDEWER